MRLGDLIAADEVLSCEQAGWAGLEISGAIRDDSRTVEPGDLFVAVPGLRVDGHDFAEAAVRRGAVAVVAGRALDLPVACVVVADPVRALALCAARIYGNPGRALELVGITGTNGKTTTTYLIEAILEGAGHRPGVVGTVAYRIQGRAESAPFTTPTAPVLQELLGRMRDQGCSHVVMEVSSHALELGRIWGCSFSVAAFTHLTQDHLDLHGSMERYLGAKLLLFARHLAPGGTAVVNLDGDGADAVVQLVRKRGDLRLVTCSSQGPADVTLVDPRFSMNGLRATLRAGGEGLPIRSPLVGAFNADNILMAAACCRALQLPLTAVAEGIARVAGVPGRLERVDGGEAFAVLVDYAHTPDALRRAMEVLRPICAGRLIVVFGCGGDRDRGKRPLMGQAVARQADLAVVTSDNPRTEQPEAIIESILEGIRPEPFSRIADLEKGRGYLVEPDRRRAIFAAVQAARPTDIVLIAGKGHEDYQILGTRRIHFDDREQAREALAERRAR